ncbi:DNA topoisomerase I [Candidatus Woesearchaeota archaeon]|jgi:DNA topoisomerase I|nr:DNA topoisomerase I [Candidatus Woesearchaeota archaeon]MBT4368606.1 DNA topoisomerase I [Candidatus Woesearchaeota archaeon]MBT4713085.1 DNA topoisomerase I [Candidatus Woesearchaeota archaeon]MBT6639007.1 DNA topoisomerase I [Candidatus Woesearchaeota archaeon]MBT7134206.1 DNA topoisomerase I [Candidatus Woesearchaeota archaeon]
MELIISEKPNAAKRIADALSDGKATKESDNKVPFYKLKYKNNDIIVGCAVGHLYGLKAKGKGFPLFDIDWVPSSELRKQADFSKKYLNTLKRLAKQCDTFTVATDFDIEGEVIGLNIVRYVAKKKDANRMKFSTLTKDELVSSYEKKESHLDWGQANAGETRHKLDWFYGINISRALTKAISSAGTYKLLSTGRVQGPALKLLADREREIKKFKPTPFWEIELTGKLENGEVIASHKNGKFEKEKEVLDILEKTKGKKANIKDIKSREFKQQPPHPFDLTSLQIEAYGKIKIPPKETLSIAQELYTSGAISYPRTSSQQLPESIGYKKILKKLANQAEFEKHATELMGKSLKPNNGKKKDEAHPAIYPTGDSPKKLDSRKGKLYELIVRRFLATFGEPALKETVTYNIDCNEEIFVTKGTVTKEKGWLEYYGTFGKQKEEELPKTTTGEEVKSKKIKKLDKETQPPKRFTEASIIKELEKRNLGTKATRASIIDTLFQRHYLDGKKLEVTELGLKVDKILAKYVPKITDEEMTRHFEEEMEKIRKEKKKPESVLAEAKKIIIEIIKDFGLKEAKVGGELRKTFTETRDQIETMGKCPNCKEGVLRIRRGRFGQFIACDKYPDCKTTFSIPSNGMVKKSEKICEECNSIMITMIKRGKRPQEVCINTDCPSKKIEAKNEGKKCPKCKKGKMVLRKSVYGHFLACDAYPKCRNIERQSKKQ